MVCKCSLNSQLFAISQWKKLSLVLSHIRWQQIWCHQYMKDIVLHIVTQVLLMVLSSFVYIKTTIKKNPRQPNKKIPKLHTLLSCKIWIISTTLISLSCLNHYFNFHQPFSFQEQVFGCLVHITVSSLSPCSHLFMSFWICMQSLQSASYMKTFCGV